MRRSVCAGACTGARGRACAPPNYESLNQPSSDCVGPSDVLGARPDAPGPLYVSVPPLFESLNVPSPATVPEPRLSIGAV